MKTAIFLLFIGASVAHGACHKSKVDFYFSNGMFNSRLSAEEGLEELKIRMLKSYPQNIYRHYKVAYNTNEFILIQLLQVYRHKMEDSTISFWKWIGNFSNLKDTEVFKEQFNKIFTEQLLNDSDLIKQVASYKQSLKEGYSVVTVAHSQGNLYANFAFGILDSDKIKLVSVATPASVVYGNGSYFTFYSDGVIAQIPDALSPNIERSSAGFFDHGFVEHYLNDPNAEAEILGAVHNSYEEFNTSNQDQVSSDLEKVMVWHDENSKQKRSEKMSDCILSYAIFKVKARNSSCEERNYANVLKYLMSCRSDRIDDKSEETSCPFWRGMDFANYLYSQVNGFPTKGNSKFLDLHPHCQMDSYADYMDKVRTSDIEEAIAALEKLKSNP